MNGKQRLNITEKGLSNHTLKAQNKSKTSPFFCFNRDKTENKQKKLLLGAERKGKKTVTQQMLKTKIFPYTRESFRGK